MEFSRNKCEVPHRYKSAHRPGEAWLAEALWKSLAAQASPHSVLACHKACRHSNLSTSLCSVPDGVAAGKPCAFSTTKAVKGWGLGRRGTNGGGHIQAPVSGLTPLAGSSSKRAGTDQRSPTGPDSSQRGQESFSSLLTTCSWPCPFGAHDTADFAPTALHPVHWQGTELGH